jgi:hypothetical protein
MKEGKSQKKSGEERRKFWVLLDQAESFIEVNS